jgi:hypothetical protein
MKRKWKVGDIEDRTMDESVEKSLERIVFSISNPIPYAEGIKIREGPGKSIEKQQDETITSSPCCGYSFRLLGVYPEVLLESLHAIGGKKTAKKMWFPCLYGENGEPLMRSKGNATIQWNNRKTKRIFKGSCFCCQTTHDTAWNAVKNYFICIKVSNLTHCYPEIPLISFISISFTNILPTHTIFTI